MKIRVVLANGAVIESEGWVVGNTTDQYPVMVEFNITQMLRLIAGVSTAPLKKEEE
jgi:hypothetical protein